VDEQGLDYGDDLFVWGNLDEGKAIGTADVGSLVLKQDMLHPKDVDPEKFKDERKKGLTVGKRKLKQVKDRVEGAMLDLLGQFHSGKINERQFKKAATNNMKTAWRDVFLAGIRAGGTPGEGAGKGKTLVKLMPGDEVWLKSAMQHEMRFLNGLVRNIIEDDYTMPLPRRIKMYVNALESFYDSARVIALPFNSLIRWHGPADKKTCPSCQYMFEHSPFTKHILPTTPRSGMTVCLTNCRDRLRVDLVEQQEAIKVTKESAYTRGGHIKNLRKIKRTGKL
jgi:hypothetical protein